MATWKLDIRFDRHLREGETAPTISKDDLERMAATPNEWARLSSRGSVRGEKDQAQSEESR